MTETQKRGASARVRLRRLGELGGEKGTMAAKVTLKDIAREVGLSPTSVSLVLNVPCVLLAKVNAPAEKITHVAECPNNLVSIPPRAG